MKKKFLIIGAGLTGMSCAFCFSKKNKDFMLAEKERHLGGLAHSFKKDNFTFDYSGHLLHLRWPETTDFVKKMLGKNIKKIQRDSKIYFKGKFIPYPFQTSLFALNDRERKICLKEFIKTLKKKRKKEKNFKDWAQNTFGKGICEYFMFPYNEKLWRHPLKKMSTLWMGQFVPVPDPKKIIESAFGKVKTQGYNGFFYYPKKNGIGALAHNIGSRIENIQKNCTLLGIKTKSKTALIENIGKVNYETLINTSPLKDFVLKIEDAPKSVKKAARRLKSNKVYILNLGLRKKIRKEHWIYFPEKKFPFYRIGFYDNFSENSAPAKNSAAYIEISAKENEKIDLKLQYKKILKALKDLRFIKTDKDIVSSMWLEVKNAYAIYDFQREKALKTINDYLLKQNIHSIGRYGAWKYSFMEENIKDGFETANKLS